MHKQNCDSILDLIHWINERFGCIKYYHDNNYIHDCDNNALISEYIAAQECGLDAWEYGKYSRTSIKKYSYNRLL